MPKTNAMKQKEVILLIIIFSFLCYIIFRHKEEKNVNGIVKNVIAGVNKDIVVELYDNDTIYYMNRAIKNETIITNLKRKLVNKNISINYSKNNNLLNPFRNPKSIEIVKLSMKNDLIYSTDY
jgi:CTP synthase (UTP-ammonia lyase)